MSAYAEGTIAAVSLVGPASAPIKCQLDASAFFDPFEGTITPAADGTQHVQLVAVGTAGKRFAVYFDNLPLTVAAAIKAAVSAALAGGDSFAIVLADDAHSISVDAVPDYSAGQWFSYDDKKRHNNVYLEKVEMRFLSVA